MLRALVVALVVLGLCPGGYGFVEDAVHLVQEGHLIDAHAHRGGHVGDDVRGNAHNEHDDLDGSHEAPGDEHGCSGAFHTCGCHAGAVFVVDVTGPPALRLPLLSMREGRFPRVDGDASADVLGFDRPPRA